MTLRNRALFRFNLYLLLIVLGVTFGPMANSNETISSIQSNDNIRTLYGSLNGSPAELDPARVVNSAQWHTMLNLGVTLVTHDSGGRLVGEGASSWKVSPDLTEFEFQLATDLRDSSGNGLDSSDWKASFIHLLTSGGSTHSFISEYLDIRGVQTPSKDRLILKLKRPYKTLLQRLTTPEFILVPRVSIKPGNKIDLKIASGSYYVESLQETPQRCILRANHFHRHFSLAQPERVVIESWASSNLDAFNKLAAGEWQFYLGTILPTDPNFAALDKMIREEKVHIEPTEPSSIAMLIVMDSARLKLPAQKLALAKLLGEKAESEFSTQSARATHQLYPPGFVGAIPINRERELFGKIKASPESTLKNLPKKLIAYEASVSTITGVSKWIRDTLQAAGVQVEFHEANVKNYVGKQKSIDHDYMAFTTGLNSKDPAGSLLYLISPKDGFVPDPDGHLNSLLMKAVESEGQARTELLHQLSEKLMMTGRIIPLMHYGMTVLSSSQVEARPPSRYDDELKLSEIRWKGGK